MSRERFRHGRPPWWPADEPWPPEGRPQFARRFMRRVVFGVAAFIAVIIISGIILGAIFGDREHGPPPFVLIPIGIVVAVFIFAGSRAARRFAGPVADVMETVNRVAAGDYSARVTADGPGPVRDLGESVNTMASRLQDGEEQRRVLVADIAHEVRTPLAVIRGNLEGILDGLYQPDAEHLAPMLDQVAVIARLVDDLQTLSSAEAGMLRVHSEKVRLDDLIRDVVQSFQPGASARGVALEAAPATETSLEVDPVRIHEVLSNLVENALRHTGDGGTVTISLIASAGEVTIAVADTGSGISQEDLPHIFDRYRKAADSKGSGLGLAIARRLVEAHGGAIRAESQPGHGTTIAFTLPRDGAT